MTEYDVAIVGAGPNGETLAAYLSKAGAKCIILERRDEMGGGLATQDYGGFRFNLHATYMMMAELMPPVDDLFLAQYGVNFIRPEVQASLFYETDKSFTLYLDPKKTAESITKLASAGEASKFLNFYHDIEEANLKCLLPTTYRPPMAPVELATMLSSSEIGQHVLDWSEQSPLEMLDHYEIRDDRVRAALLYLGCKWGIEPDLPGIGYMFAIYVYRMLNAALVGGGTHRLNSGIMRSAYENGIAVQENTEVVKVLLEDGRAVGVKTADGQEIRAKAVVSTLPPQQTFLQMVGEEHLDPGLVETIRAWELDEWSLFMTHLGVRRLPKYTAEKNDPHCGEAFTQIVGYSSSQDVIDHWKKCQAKTLPGPGATATPMSFWDPTQAPRDGFTVRLESETPFDITGSSWEKEKKPFGDRLIANWKEYLSNPDEIRIVKRFDYPPTYIEAKLPSMIRGSIKHGAYLPTQMGYFRPNTDCSNYSTPIPGLYTAGASTYPGGMITLGPGYNAALKIAQDLNLKVWWKTPKYVQDGIDLGLVP
ncbi:MAG: NAD(P)/FAD-dependent oxidoreductase [Thermoplasmata archaeon]